MDNWIDGKLLNFKKARNEKVISKNGAFVVLGRDRATSAASNDSRILVSRPSSAAIIGGIAYFVMTRRNTINEIAIQIANPVLKDSKPPPANR